MFLVWRIQILRPVEYAGPAKKSGEYRTFLQLWQTAHSAEFADLKSARDTVLLHEFTKFENRAADLGEDGAL
jgi:hypothetical protein